MACEQYLNAIHDRVDGTLGAIRGAELDQHLEICVDCRALLADLQKIAGAARALGPIEPPDRIWMQIAGRLHQEGRVKPVAAAPPAPRHTYTLLALAATLLLAVGGSLLLVFPRHQANIPAAAGNAEQEDPVQRVDSELQKAEEHFNNALDEAEKIEGMDATTIAGLRQNLQDVNQALAQSRAALTSNPHSTTARQSLYEVLKQKIQFLQTTIALMNEMRQGDAEGAARLVEGKS
jgi:hypothetical protein